VIRLLKLTALGTTLVVFAAACGSGSLDLSAVADTQNSPPSSSTTTVQPASTVPPTTTVSATTTSTEAVQATTTAPSTTEPPAALDLQLPTLIMVEGNTVRSVGPDDDGSMASYVELVADAPVAVAYMAGDFTVVVEEHPDPADPFGSGRIVHYLQDGTREVIPGVDRLFGVEVVNGEESVIAAQDNSLSFSSGDLVAIGLETGTVVTFGLAWAPEYGVGSVEWSDFGTAVVSAWSDLTESVTYVDEAGANLILPSPTDDLAYASAPLVQAAAISPDGRMVVWAEGPDQAYDDASGEFVMVGDKWVVKGMNLDTGAVEFAMPINFEGVDPSNSVIDAIRYSPTHLVVNRLQYIGDTVAYMAPVIIDMTGAEPATVAFEPVGNSTLFPSASFAPTTLPSTSLPEPTVP